MTTPEQIAGPTEAMLADGWIKHDGGPCPVPLDSRPLVMFRDGFGVDDYPDAPKDCWPSGRARSHPASCPCGKARQLERRSNFLLQIKDRDNDGQTSAPSNLRADTTSNAKGAEFPQPLSKSGRSHIPRLASTRSDYRCSAASQGPGHEQ